MLGSEAAPCHFAEGTASRDCRRALFSLTKRAKAGIIKKSSFKRTEKRLKCSLRRTQGPGACAVVRGARCVTHRSAYCRYQPVLIKKALGIETASAKPNSVKVGKLTKAQVEEIAKIKMPDLNCTSLESAISMVAGTARSMGVTVEE